MENPKKLYSHPEWPPHISIEHEAVNEGCLDYDSYASARDEVKEKFEEGRD